MSRRPIRVTVWNEYVHERSSPAVGAIYPQGIHGAVAAGLRAGLGTEVAVRTATLDEPEHGLDERTLGETDVLMWWGHAAHAKVSDAVVERAHRRVLEGMGLIVMHSAHLSKLFVKLMGTTCLLRWREAGEKERLWIVNPSHTIAEGLESDHFELPHTEMYGEPFDIPAPEELIFISWFEGGEVFRSGCTFRRGKGKIFYFRPGHETFPIYHDANVRRVLCNGVRWAAPTGSPWFGGDGRHIPEPLSPIASGHVMDESLHKPA